MERASSGVVGLSGVFRMNCGQRNSPNGLAESTCDDNLVLLDSSGQVLLGQCIRENRKKRDNPT